MATDPFAGGVRLLLSHGPRISRDSAFASGDEAFRRRLGNGGFKDFDGLKLLREV
jgi:hypothetical protein